MSRKFYLLTPISFIILFVSACGHEHTYSEATCTTPKTCIECSETEGAPLGHQLIEATCESLQYCNVCNETFGEKLKHTISVGVCDLCNEFQGKDVVQ